MDVSKGNHEMVLVILLLIQVIGVMMFDEERIVRKSLILTNHSPLKAHSSSVPSLSLPPQQALKKSRPAKVISIKTREELIKEDRFRNLLKLKINLNDLHIQQLEFKERMRPKKQRDASMPERMEVRLNQIMANHTEPDAPQPQRVVNGSLEEIDFLQCCESLSRVCEVIRTEGNMHFKNKIINFTYSMKNETEILALFEKLLNQVPAAKLYKKYHRLLHESNTFKKELNALAIQSRHIVEVYEKSRYNYLNADIIRRSNEMAAQGKEITGRLPHIQDWRMRKGLYGSLQRMQFECMANRNLYEQLTQRVKSMDM